MKLLLDTHILLWFFAGDPQLGARLRLSIENTDNEKWVSIASIWEIAIKVSTGKLILSQPLDIFIPDQLRRNGFQLLPIQLPHILQVATLPFHHREPFDRMIAAQSLVENMPLLSVDTIFDAYGVQRLTE